MYGGFSTKRYLGAASSRIKAKRVSGSSAAFYRFVAYIGTNVECNSASS